MLCYPGSRLNFPTHIFQFFFRPAHPYLYGVTPRKYPCCPTSLPRVLEMLRYLYLGAFRVTIRVVFTSSLLRFADTVFVLRTSLPYTGRVWLATSH